MPAVPFYVREALTVFVICLSATCLQTAGQSLDRRQPSKLPWVSALSEFFIDGFRVWRLTTWHFSCAVESLIGCIIRLDLRASSFVVKQGRRLNTIQTLVQSTFWKNAEENWKRWKRKMALFFDFSCLDSRWLSNQYSYPEMIMFVGFIRFFCCCL